MERIKRIRFILYSVILVLTILALLYMTVFRPKMHPLLRGCTKYSGMTYRYDPSNKRPCAETQCKQCEEVGCKVTDFTDASGFADFEEPSSPRPADSIYFGENPLSFKCVHDYTKWLKP